MNPVQNKVTQPEVGQSTSRRLPRRDLWLLPLLSIATMVFLLVSGEVVARSIWKDQSADPCGIRDGGRQIAFRPSCESRTKVPESGWVVNDYNECGFRTRESCGTKPSQNLRVAVLGTSFSYGYMTPYDDAYTSLASRDLSAICHRHVEFQNLGIPEFSVLDVYHRVDEALAIQPDVLMVALNPSDVRKEIPEEAFLNRDVVGLHGANKGALGSGGFMKRYIVDPLKGSRALYVLQHYLYQDPDTYLNLFLVYGDNAGYLRHPFSTEWQARFAKVDVLLSEIHSKAEAAHVPVVLFIGPMASQVALLNANSRPGVDAYAFSTRMRQSAAKSNIPVIDALPKMQVSSHAMGLMYVVDGHFNPKGQQLLASALESSLPADAGSAFASCAVHPSSAGVQ